jgi:YtkA-like protein
MSKKLWLSLTIVLLLCACRNNAELKTVQTQKAGDVVVTVLSETGSIKNGANDFFLEFRKTDGNQLIDVGTVDVAPVMEMAGMAPMMGSATVMPTETPGRYRVTGSLTMAGLWKFNVKFGSGQTVRINVNAQ